MILKTGRKCKWEEIEIGEIFAWNGCWEILYKYSNTEVIRLTDNWMRGFPDQEILRTDYGTSIPIYYKLPLSVQRLWKEE